MILSLEACLYGFIAGALFGTFDLAISWVLTPKYEASGIFGFIKSISPKLIVSANILLGVITGIPYSIIYQNVKSVFPGQMFLDGVIYGLIIWFLMVLIPMLYGLVFTIIPSSLVITFSFHRLACYLIYGITVDVLYHLVIF